jgi:predicted ATPase
VPRFADEEIAEYLGNRGISAHLRRSARQLRSWTGGNPLFLEVVFDQLQALGCVTADEGVRDLEGPAIPTPPSLRDIVNDRIQRLTSDERRLLEAAIVIGQTFSAAAVAAAVGTDVEQVERAFDSLAYRHQFLARADAAEAAGADVTASYAFLHSLYASVLYDRLPPHSRVALHRAIAGISNRRRPAP